jgi:hypothetical protein
MRLVIFWFFICLVVLSDSSVNAMTQSEIVAKASEAADKARKAAEKIGKLRRGQRAEYQMGRAWYYGQLENSTGTQVWGFPKGVGRLTFNDEQSEFAGNIYEGQWDKFSDGSYFHGHGVYRWIAEGPWQNTRYEGQWKKGQATGWGIQYYPGDVLHYGVFMNGVLDLELRVIEIKGVVETLESAPSGATNNQEAVLPSEDGTEISGPQESDDSSTMELEKAKENCQDIGFSPGTEKFGDCVLRLLGG